MYINHKITAVLLSHNISIILFTLIEHPIRAPLRYAFEINESKSEGALSPRLYLCTNPPVKSVSASPVNPPSRASYDPLSLTLKIENN